MPTFLIWGFFVVILLSSQQTQIFGFEPHIAAVLRNIFSRVVFTNWWKIDFLIRRIRWNVSTVYLGSNGFNSPERQNLTNVFSSWEVHTDNRTQGQICVLMLSPCQQGWTNPWTFTGEQHVQRTIPDVRQAAMPAALQQRWKAKFLCFPAKILRLRPISVEVNRKTFIDFSVAGPAL